MKNKVIKSFEIYYLVVMLFFLLPTKTNAQSCSEMEETGSLLYQQFEKGKICKPSEMGDGGKICMFKVGNTEIHLRVGSKKGQSDDKQRFTMDGIKIVSVSPELRVRIFTGSHFGLIVRIERKSNSTETGCMYDEAYLSLKSEILGPEDLNRMMYGSVPPSENIREQTKHLQGNLTRLGFNLGKIDGIPGPMTIAAFEKYKQERQFQPTLLYEEINKILSIEAFFKGAVELEEMEDGGWQPKSLRR